MIIGIDGSRAFLKYRTGIEEYSYQVIKHLREELPKETQVRVYVRKKIALEKGKLVLRFPEIDFSFPENWTLVGLWAPRFWTQIRLSLEMLFHPVDALFIPAHTVPVIHSKNTTVVVHGLEYEVSKESYTLWERFYMRHSISFSVKAAKKIVAVSENTKQDLIRLYKVPAEKITVVYEGYALSENFSAENTQSESNSILFIGRIEERKNIGRIIEAFNLMKEKYQLPSTLILAGKPGHQYESIRATIENSKYKDDIQELGYISVEKKTALLKEARVFLFPSLYEGFGLPILESQALGVPVITSSLSSLPEVGGEAALYIDPYNVEEITEKIHQVLTFTPEEYNQIVGKGYENVSRFSWKKCAQELKKMLLGA